MAPRTLLLLAASVVIGIASISATATDAFAKKRAKAAPRPVVASAVVLAPDNGPPAFGIPHCIDSVIFYPYPPCY